MNLSQWFGDQLQASANGFAWGAEQVPNPRRSIQPPEGLGEWTAARHVFHLLYYEQNIALPSMRQWLGEACPSMDELDEDAPWTTKAQIWAWQHRRGYLPIRDRRQMVRKHLLGRTANETSARNR